MAARTREPDDERGVALEDAVINDLAVDQRIDDANACVQNDDEKKERQKAGIGKGESHHALRCPRLHFLFHHRWVLHEGAHRSHHSCHPHDYSFAFVGNVTQLIGIRELPSATVPPARAGGYMVSEINGRAHPLVLKAQPNPG